MAVLARSIGWRRCGTILGIKERHRKMKLRTFAHVAIDPQTAAMHLDEVLGDGQTETGAAGFAGARDIDAVEAFEDARLVGFGDTDAGIRDRKNDLGSAGYH